MVKKISFIVLMLLVLLSGLVVHYFHLNPFNPLHRGRLTVGELTREFVYYVPKSLAEHPGLLFVLHGSEMSSGEMRRVTGKQFDRFADKYGDVVVVYPQGFHGYWNDCRKTIFCDAQKLNVDDVRFFEMMSGYFFDKYAVDTTRQFAVGYSNGGQMCYRLAREKPQMFKGVAILCANLPESADDRCTDAGKPVSILIMNGTSDPVSPFDGGEVTLRGAPPRGKVLSAMQTLDFWLARDSCDSSAGTRYDFPDLKKRDSSTVVRYSYNSPHGDKCVTLVKIINGGHTIPNPGFSLWSKALGNVNKDINAPEVIVEFFRKLK